MAHQDQSSFTGRTRKRTTNFSVKLGDVASKWIITLGGIGTIAAVTLVAVYLAWVVFPLFLPAAVKNSDVTDVSWDRRQPLMTSVDEYRELAWALFPDGAISSLRLRSGQPLEQLKLIEQDQKLTAWAANPGLDQIAFGFEDGSVRKGDIKFKVEFVPEDQIPASMRGMKVGEVQTLERGGKVGLVERTPEKQFRFTYVGIDVSEPLPVVNATPVVAIDMAESPSATRVCALHEDGTMLMEEIRERTNILTGKTTFSVKETVVPYEPPPGRGRPDYLKLTGLGDNVYAIWKDGVLQRYDVRDFDETQWIETVDLLEDDEQTITDAQFLIGKRTLVISSSAGEASAWFRIKPDNAPTADGALLAKAHDLPTFEGQITTLAASERGRLLAIGYADGRVRVIHVTSHQIVADLTPPGDQPGSIDELQITPKADGVVARMGSKLAYWHFDPRHPEVTFSSLFTPVWYEGYNEPTQVWQSSSATDDFEEKFGLYPLIFGTLKATFYSMLFGVPLAVGAAIYTSEFLHPKVKARIKPTIEVMASLPSVVLGFLAALVIAPFVENIVPAMVVAFAAVPVTFLIGAYLWQLLPHRLAIKMTPYRLYFLVLTLPISLAAAYLIGPVVETLLFAGDFKLWLDARMGDERFGNGVGGWLILLLPFSAVFVGLLMMRLVNPFLRERTNFGRGQLALLQLAKFFVAAVVALALALLLGVMLQTMGFDPRGGVLDTYVQRNALVVGFIMGFAVIPIIYTISEDALSAVPEHLRAASLATGATPWQTATRVIIPTAMSGMFSAVMIGFGRAVGETMIVLMAAGNTPVMEMNIFNGFRTLSANIAVELPEAVVNSTHYRTLYLAALVLFIMTFALNTVAELVRQRFRKRAFEL